MDPHSHYDAEMKASDGHKLQRDKDTHLWERCSEPPCKPDLKVDPDVNTEVDATLAKTEGKTAPPEPKPAAPVEPAEKGGVPEPISEEAPTHPIRAGEEIGEIVGEYRISGEKGLHGDTFERDILGIKRRGGPTTDIRPIKQLFRDLIQEARAAGATRLRITGQYIRNQNVLRMRRIMQEFGGTVSVTGSMSNEIIIPL